MKKPDDRLSTRDDKPKTAEPVNPIPERKDDDVPYGHGRLYQRFQEIVDKNKK